MPELTKLEIGTFMKLYNRGGYVLNFSTNDFDVFTMDSIGVPLCEKYQLSKGKSLVAYIQSALDEDKYKLIKDLFDYYELHFEQEYIEQEDEEYLLDIAQIKENRKTYYKCKGIMSSLNITTSPLSAAATELKEKFSSKYLSKQIELMLTMQSTNPTDAIGKSKELIESCCKTILEERSVSWDKNWDVGKLTNETIKLLQLHPDNVPSSEASVETIKAILGNLRAIATKLAELRNPYGTGHGKSASFMELEERHAKLAVGSSITFVNFLWDTHEYQK